jgi:hypothetical protein
MRAPTAADMLACKPHANDAGGLTMITRWYRPGGFYSVDSVLLAEANVSDDEQVSGRRRTSGGLPWTRSSLRGGSEV